MIRAVLDTNVIISGIIKENGPPAHVLEALFHRRFIVITSLYLLQEVERVLTYPKIAKKYHIDPEAAEITLSALTVQSDLIQNPTSLIKASRDPTDDALLSLAVHGHASFLVTGDNDLLDLETFRGIRIVSPEVFLQALPAFPR